MPQPEKSFETPGGHCALECTARWTGSESCCSLITCSLDDWRSLSVRQGSKPEWSTWDQLETQKHRLKSQLSWHSNEIRATDEGSTVRDWIPTNDLMAWEGLKHEKVWTIQGDKATSNHTSWDPEFGSLSGGTSNSPLWSAKSRPNWAKDPSIVFYPWFSPLS